MDSRYTQFQGFAKALLDELIDNEGARVVSNHWRARVESIIACRAYDFACHVIDNSRANYLEDAYTHEIIPVIPDMDELPKEQE